MTVTSPLPRTPRHPASGLRRCAVALALAVLLVLSVVAPAVAATDDEEPEVFLPAATSFTLAPLSGGVLSADSALQASAVVVNNSARDLPPTAATLELSAIPLTDRARLESWLDGDVEGITTSSVVTHVVGPVPTGEQQSVTMRLDADDPALSNLEPGVYPVLGRYDDLVSTSAVVVPGDATSAVAVVLPVTAEPATDGLLTRDELVTLTASDGDLTALLDAAEGTAATLAVDPAIAAAVRVLGSAAPASAVAWLERLMTLPNPRFALQFGDADVAVQVAAGQNTPLSPTSLAAYIDPENLAAAEGEPAPEPTVTPSPSATPGGEDAVALPTLEDLLDVGAVGTTVYAPVPEGATEDVVSVLAGDESETVTLVSSTFTAQGADGSTVPAAGAVGESAAPVLVVDSGISEAVSAAAAEDEVLLRAAPVAAATALTALAAEDGGPLLVMLDRGAERSRLALHAGLSAVLDAPGAEAVDLGFLTAATAPSVELTAPGTPDDRVDAFSRLREDEDRVDAFSSILEEPEMLTGPQRATLLQLIAVSWTATPGPWSIAVNDAYAATTATLDSVGILPPSSIQLLSSETPLPFWIRNDLPFEVDVVLFASPDDLRLEVQRMTPVTSAPASNTRVQVPVQARVGSGEVMIDLQLRSPTGVAIGERQSADVYVRAEWEAFGIVGLAVLVGGLLVIGAVRTVRRRSRRRGGSDPDDPDSDGDRETDA